MFTNSIKLSQDLLANHLTDSTWIKEKFFGRLVVTYQKGAC